MKEERTNHTRLNYALWCLRMFSDGKQSSFVAIDAQRRKKKKKVVGHRSPSKKSLPSLASKTKQLLNLMGVLVQIHKEEKNARPVQPQKILYRCNVHSSSSSSSSSYLDIPGSSLPRSLRGRSDDEINKLGGTVAEKETISVGLPVLGPDPLGQRRLCWLLVGRWVVVASGDLFPFINVHRKSIRL